MRSTGGQRQHEGYRLSQRVPKRVEEIFGWMKAVSGGRKLRYIGTRKNEPWATLTRRYLQPRPDG